MCSDVLFAESARIMRCIGFVTLTWAVVQVRSDVIKPRHCLITFYSNFITGMFPVGDTSCRTLIDVCVCVCVCVCVSLSADISLNCAKNDSTDYPEILWVCWV